MAAEIALIGVAKLALEEGVKFMYEQAREVLTAWRARRKDPAAPQPVIVPAPTEVSVGTAQPAIQQPDQTAIDTLQELKDAAEAIKDGRVSVEDPTSRQVIADLREMLEAALGTSISLAGEAQRPVRIRDISIVTKDVAGRVTGVRARLDQLARTGGEIEGVEVQADEVQGGGEVIGVDLT